MNVDTGEITVTAAYEDFDDLWWPFTTGTGHSGACLASLETAEQERVRADARRRLDVPDGSFTLTARAWWARAAVPEAQPPAQPVVGPTAVSGRAKPRGQSSPDMPRPSRRRAGVANDAS